MSPPSSCIGPCSVLPQPDASSFPLSSASFACLAASAISAPGPETSGCAARPGCEADHEGYPSRPSLWNVGPGGFIPLVIPELPVGYGVPIGSNRGPVFCCLISPTIPQRSPVSTAPGFAAAFCHDGAKPGFAAVMPAAIPPSSDGRPMPAFCFFGLRINGDRAGDDQEGIACSYRRIASRVRSEGGRIGPRGGR